MWFAKLSYLSLSSASDLQSPNQYSPLGREVHVSDTYLDEDPPPAVREKWKDLFREMKELSRVEFPRSLTRADAEEPPMLCVFSDASQYAFGACAYSRQRINDDQYQVRLIAAKSRLAPLKQLSIPRLELQAAVLASRLAR